MSKATFGVFIWMIVSHYIIHHEIIINKKDRRWLEIYLYISFWCFIGYAAIQLIF